MKGQADNVLNELLVIQCRKGNEAALKALINKWNPKMKRQAYFLTGDNEAIKDIAQESWHTIIRKLDTLRDPARFGIWVSKIVKGKSVDWIRKQQRKRDIFSELTDSNNIYETTDEEEQLALLRGALKRLAPEQRLILSMHYLDQLSVAGISEVLEIPAGTVKSRLFHARNKLEKIYNTLSK